MRVVKVVDASALAALVFGEPDAEIMLAEMKGCVLAAPALLPFELANVCLKKMQRHPRQRESLLDAYKLLGEIDIELIDVEFSEVIVLAEKAALTAYDAAYLWLARILKVELITLDKRLARAVVK